MRKLLFLLMIGFTSLVQADGDHGMTQILGEHIQLQYHDHGLAGAIQGRLVYGSMLDDEFGSEVTIREGRGVQYKARLTNENNKISGKIVSGEGTEQERTTTVEFEGIDQESNSARFRLNGELVKVEVQAEGMQGNHFINPEYSLIYKGETIRFKIQDGTACWGCSVNLIFMIVGTYIH